MKKWVVIFVLVVVAASVSAEKSDNVSLSEGWEVYYEKGWSGQPVKFSFYNVSGYTAFNIIWVVNFYDSFDKYLGRVQGRELGPIHKQFFPIVSPPKDYSKMTGEVYCDWK